MSGRAWLFAASGAAILLAAADPAIALQATAKNKSKAKAAYAVIKPSPPAYPPRLATFPCQAGLEAASLDVAGPGGGGLRAARRMAGRVGATVASAVADRFTVSGEDGIFLCSAKVKTRLVERAARSAGSATDQTTSSTASSPTATSGAKRLGLAAFADVKGDMRPALFRMNATQASLQSMVERIATAWPYPNAPHPKVLVNAGLRFNAEATPDNTIIVWLGVFAPPENGADSNLMDTDLYWLLAHEYAHIALGHTDKAEAIFGQVQLAGNLASAYMSGAQLASTLKYGESHAADPKLGKRIDDAKQAHESLRFMTKMVIEPAWGLANEDEADTAGTDLVTSLGYYPRFSYVAERFSISEASWDDRFKTAQGVIGERVASTVAEPGFKAALDTGQTGQALGDVGESIKKGAYAAGRKWVFDYISRDHRASKARDEGLDRYKKSAYASAGLQLEARPIKGESIALLGSREVKDALVAARAVEAAQDALLTGDASRARAEIAKALATPFQREAYVRFWAARVALASGDRNSAIQHLEAARHAPSVSPDAYRELATLYTRSGQIAKSTPIIAEGRARTGDSDFFLPEDVRIAARTMDKDVLGPLMNQCRAVKRERIALDCTEAMADIDWEKLSPEQRKVAMEYAVWGDVAFTNPSKKAPPTKPSKAKSE